MKKMLFSLLATGLVLSSNALAETIFSCQVKNGKIAKLEKLGDQYRYSFGKPNNIEITVKNSANQVLSNRFTGTDMFAYSESVYAAIVNGQYSYILHSYFSTKGGDNANVVVLKNGKKLARLSCVNWEDEFDRAIRDKQVNTDDVIDLID